jgi:anti-sigma B factor antagonist
MADHGTHRPSNNSAPLLTVQHQRRGPAVLVRFTGEVDMLSADVMRDALTTALTDAAPPHPVVVDLTGIGFFGSVGLARLIEAHQHAIGKHVRLRIVATSRTVLRPLEITGLTGTFDIRQDITTALAPSPPDPATDREAR